MSTNIGKNALLQFSLAYEQGNDSIALRNPVAVDEYARGSDRMCFNTAFFFFFFWLAGLWFLCFG